MSRTIRVAHSPDSDDAFMFYALAAGKIDTGDLVYEHQLQDIETLNQRARRKELDISAVSIHAYAYIAHDYALLSSVEPRELLARGHVGNVGGGSQGRRRCSGGVARVGHARWSRLAPLASRVDHTGDRGEAEHAGNDPGDFRFGLRGGATERHAALAAESGPGRGTGPACGAVAWSQRRAAAAAEVPRGGRAAIGAGCGDRLGHGVSGW